LLSLSLSLSLSVLYAAAVQIEIGAEVDKQTFTISLSTTGSKDKFEKASQEWNKYVQKQNASDSEYRSRVQDAIANNLKNMEPGGWGSWGKTNLGKLEKKYHKTKTANLAGALIKISGVFGDGFVADTDTVL